MTAQFIEMESFMHIGSNHNITIHGNFSASNLSFIKLLDLVLDELRKGQMDMYSSLFKNLTLYGDGVEISIPIYYVSFEEIKNWCFYRLSWQNQRKIYSISFLIFMWNVAKISFLVIFCVKTSRKSPLFFLYTKKEEIVF